MKKKSLFGALILVSLMLILAVAPVASAADYIMPEAAVQAALTHAGVAEADAAIIRVKLDKDNGIVQYEVEFYVGNTEYDYEVNAETAAIMKFDSEIESPAKNPASEMKNLITEEQAKQAAYQNANVAPADVTLLLAQLEYDDGRWKYEIEFYQNTTEYDYEIDAKTGAVLTFDQDTDHGFDSELVYSSATAVSPSAAEQTAVGAITADQAKKIALAHAGFQETDVQKLKVKTDRDDGLTKLEVEFEVGRTEYSYEINAADGSIVDFHKDND